MAEQQTVNPELADLANKLGVGMIATNDVHYLNHGDKEAHDVLCCISTRDKMSNDDRFCLPTDQFFPEVAGGDGGGAACVSASAGEHAARGRQCATSNLISRSATRPSFATPAKKTADECLRELVYAGAAERGGTGGEEETERRRDVETK
jgi:DNA polymerase-3 subunit alpha